MVDRKQIHTSKSREIIKGVSDIDNVVRPTDLKGYRTEDEVLAKIIQKAITGKAKAIMITSDRYGVGKTTLANILASIHLGIPTKDLIDGSFGFNLLNCAADSSKDAVESVIKRLRSPVLGIKSSSVRSQVLILDEIQFLQPAALKSVLEITELPATIGYSLVIMVSSQPDKIQANEALASRCYHISLPGFKNVQSMIDVLSEARDKLGYNTSDRVIKAIAKKYIPNIRYGLRTLEMFQDLTEEEQLATIDASDDDEGDFSSKGLIVEWIYFRNQNKAYLLSCLQESFVKYGVEGTYYMMVNTIIAQMGFNKDVMFNPATSIGKELGDPSYTKGKTLQVDKGHTHCDLPMLGKLTRLLRHLNGVNMNAPPAVIKAQVITAVIQSIFTTR